MRLFTLSFALAFTAFGYSQFVEIPDDNFVEYLTALHPECMNGNLMDISCNGIISDDAIDCSGLSIENLSGVEHFINLSWLDARNNPISTLPELPTNLDWLLLSHHLLTTLPALPETLTILHVSSSEELEALPELPQSLRTLERNYTPNLVWPLLPEGLVNLQMVQCELTEIPTLPESLTQLRVDENPLSFLPTLPENLEILRVRDCTLSELLNLPSNLKHLTASLNPLMTMPVLPEGLEELLVYQTGMTMITGLPESLRSLDAGFDQIEYIQPLPAGLDSLWLVECPLTLLPELPHDNMDILYIRDVPITCFTNLPEHINSFTADYTEISCFPSEFTYEYLSDILQELDLPVCILDDTETNPASCATVSFNGKVSLDTDNDCMNPGLGIPAIPLNIYENGNFISTISTSEDGGYKKYGTYNEYTVALDLNSIPFEVNCPTPGNEITTTLSELNPQEDLEDFQIYCGTEPDYEALGGIVSGFVFPGQTVLFQSQVLEVSNLFSINCFNGISGTVSVTFTGPVTIGSIPEYALTPVIDGLTVTYTIPDLSVLLDDSLLSLWLDINESAQLGESICAEIAVNADITEINVENNSINYCFEVFNSFDPNNKLVSPFEVEPGYSDWLNYTINFQNTGNAPAFHIRLEDELSNLLDPTTFQQLNSSHDSHYELTGNNLTIFYPDILLPDSTSNEPDSKGYFQFRIKPSSPIIVGAPVNNFAAIFFDFNDPIITNTAVTEALLIDGVNESALVDFKIYPNPSHGIITLETANKIQHISALNLLGEKIDFSSRSARGAMQLTFGPTAKGLVVLRLETDKGVYFEKVFLE